MTIKDLFFKPIDRSINGVIKVAQQDDANVQQELEEYVVTRELDTHFHTFFDAFAAGLSQPNGDVGVWIAGFFGSGKSHLLKIMWYLLENRVVAGKRAVLHFDDGSKVQDAMLMGNIKRAANASIDVIPFNIDSKADATAKNDKDSIVKVFQKVFDDYLDFFGTVPAIASFERQLEARGVLEAFKAAFEQRAGQAWLTARDGWAFERDTIVQALQDGASMTEAAASSAFAAFDKPSGLSVEAFARTVNTYLERKGPAQRVVFMVDEVGQYIGSDSRLMLNLQTVVEDLAVRTGGRAWVVVTSQEAMDQITKNMREMDFSKIQGRFKHRINLSSANTDEVIKLRLLLKNEPAKAALEALYAGKAAVLKNLITFTEAPNLPAYRNEADFVGAYPFVPYQFNLLQKVFTQIRVVGAAGKHLSEGERSLLDAFQGAARLVADRPLGALAPFSTFYEAIQNFVDGSIRRVIDQAANNAQLEAFDLEVLKTLFMVKNLKEIPANLENLTTLHVTSIDEDKLVLRERVQASVARLEAQTLVQRQGDRYEFLTNEEQDVGREIKQQPIDQGDITAKLQELAWDGVLKDRKFKYSSRHTYEFNRKLDDRVYGKPSSDIGVNLITPYASRYRELQNDQACILETANSVDVLVRLSNDPHLIADVTEWVKTKKYVNRKSGSGLTATMRNIIEARSSENSEREVRIEKTLQTSIAQATVFASGAKLEIRERDARSVVQEGLRSLVDNAYSKLQYVRKPFDAEDDVINALLADSSVIALDGTHANAPAHSEMLAWIEDQGRRLQTVTIRALITQFGGKPYGWPELDTLGVMAELLNAGTLELRFAQGLVDIKERGLLPKLRAKSGLEQFSVRPTQVVDSTHIGVARKLAPDLLGLVTVPTDTPKLLGEYRAGLEQKRALLETWAARANERQYPFQEALSRAGQRLKDLLKVDSSAQFFAQIKSQEAMLEDLIDDQSVWKAFFEKQVKLFDAARADLIALEPDVHHIVDSTMLAHVGNAREILALPDPTQRIPNLPGHLEPVKQHVQDLLAERIKAFGTAIEVRRQELEPLISQLPASAVREALEPFDRALERLAQAKTLDAVIARNAELEQALAWSHNSLVDHINAVSTVQATPDAPKPKPLVRVRVRDLAPGVLETNADLEAFLMALRSRLEHELTINRVTLE
jgi:hypothetical protein